ncbi:hypothetical protein NKDENANG_02046 [Candidatus Entotheonellaceae bacterium PAL068K]
MTAFLLRMLESLFPVHRHEWPKALSLLSAAIFLGMGFSVSRASSEALFLTRFGIDYLPLLQLVNPILVLIATTIYGTFANRLSNDRLMIYTVIIPVPFILLMRLLMEFHINLVYFFLYAFVLAYASVLTTSWAVYLPGHYDVQEAKRLLPFISSGILIGTVVGGIGVAASVPILGAANVLFVWIGTLLGVIVVIYSIDRRFTSMDAEARKAKPVGQKPKQKPGVLSNLKAGITYSRSSALFLTTAVATIATFVAFMLIDFEYSKIFARHYPTSAQLTAFLGVVDGLTTVLALGVQWFIVPRCIRRLGVQGTNLLFPYMLTAAFGGLLMAPVLLPAIFARFTRYSLMPSLRGTTRTLILNAVPRKTGALVRSFNTGVILPIGQAIGAMTLLFLKGLEIPILFPLLGFVITVIYVFFTHKQNKAYGGALLELLKEDKIHLLDLEDDEIRQLDAAAVDAISKRLSSDQAEVSQAAEGASAEQTEFVRELVSAQEESSLTAIELLRTIGTSQAFAALRQHLPYAAPRLTAAALQALAIIGGEGAADILHPYLADAQPQVRMAAMAGLRQLDDPTLPQRVLSLLDDPDVQVRAMALAVVLANSQGTEYDRAYRIWEGMLESEDKETQVAALSIIAEVQEASLQGYLYSGLGRADVDIRREILSVLLQLAEAGRITALDAALLRTLEDDDTESRELALRVLAAVGSDEALNHIFVLLDDEQPRVRETLVKSVKPFGKRAIEPLLSHLQSPQNSLVAKESALLALVRLDGVQPNQLLPFWEKVLQDVYQYKLMLACMEAYETQKDDAFLLVALQNSYDQMLSLLTQLLAVWASPEVARLVSDGLYDTDRQKRAHALEAIESLSERRFTRLFLPVLEATGTLDEAWREVAQQQWNLSFGDISEVIAGALQSTDKWVVIGALLAGQAHASSMHHGWQDRIEQIAATANDADVVNAVRQALGFKVEELHRHLSLTEAMVFLKRIPLYSSMGLDQLYTIATNLVEYEMQDGEEIFSEGDPSYDLYLIVSGKIDIVKQRGNTPQTIVTLSAGDFFGDMAIFEDRPRSAGAVAAAPGVLLVLSPERFRNIILQQPTISFEIFRELSARLRRFDGETSDVAP